MDNDAVPRESESYWEGDHLEMLGRSHNRTKKHVGSGKDHDVVAGVGAGVTHRNPQSQILPCPRLMSNEVDGAKKRTRDLKSGRTRVLGAAPTMPNRAQAIKPVYNTRGDDTMHDTGWFSYNYRTVIVSFVVAVVAATIVAAVVFTPESMESTLHGLRGHSETNMTVAPIHEQIRTSRHNLQFSIFGGVATQQELPLPSLEWKISPTHYPLQHTLPVFWIVPYSGGSAVMDVLSYCMHLTLANEKSSSLVESDGQVLEVITFSDNVSHYVNVDTTTLLGLERADRLGLVESHLADVIATPHVPLVTELFTDKRNTGRIFAIIRDPVHRAVAEYIQRRDLLPSHPDFVLDLSQMQLHQYAQSDFVNENVLVRSLANVTDASPVAQIHVEIAKKVLQLYVVVGLSHKMGESMGRFFKYFGWDSDDSDWEPCQAEFVAKRDLGREEVVGPGSDEYAVLANRNWADMQLFEYAQHLFKRQAKLKPKLKRRN